jgi:hypothetical protein
MKTQKIFLTGLTFLAITSSSYACHGTNCSEWADQIYKTDVTSDRYLNIHEVSQDGKHYSDSTTDLYGIKTRQSKNNRRDINYLNQRNKHYRKEVHQNIHDINVNKNNIQTNTHKIKKVSKVVKKNSRRPDQIQSGVVNGSTMSITEESRRGHITKTTDIDMSGLVTNQGTTNTTNIQNNRTDINNNRTDINNISNTANVNVSNITKNTKWNAKQDVAISNNTAGIACNSQRIEVNTQNIQENWENIQINAGNIEYLKDWNSEQQYQINDLYSGQEYLYNSMNELTEYTKDMGAGLTALSTVDFAGYGEGEWEVGIGMGATTSDFGGAGLGGAVGVRYGVDDNTNLIGKGWVSGSSAGGAIGATWKF